MFNIFKKKPKEPQQPTEQELFQYMQLVAEIATGYFSKEWLETCREADISDERLLSLAGATQLQMIIFMMQGELDIVDKDDEYGISTSSAHWEAINEQVITNLNDKRVLN